MGGTQVQADSGANHDSRRRMPTLGSGLNEINVTPLVDVMLVLLIIFMVTAPMLKHGIDVSLPQASERLFPEGTEGRYILTIAADKQVYLDNRKIPLEHLEFKLRSLNTSTQLSALFLEADKSLPYGYVVEIMDIVKKSGIKTMGMVTKPKAIKGGK
jgi:biopolymer transport protein TolR